jgi:hypothetical protein
MKIYFATWLVDKTLGVSLTKNKARDRLLSYHFLKDQGVNSEQFSRYMRTGRLDLRKRK